MNKTSATVVADSINPQGDRLTSLLITFPRIILSEINTHRMLCKNTSSSRAIPFNKMVEAVQENPFIPIAWQKEHTGMQGNEYHDGLNNIQNDASWLRARDHAVEYAKELNELEVTKQLCNRLLEPFMWTTMLITGSKEGWDNFFELRCPSYEWEYEEGIIKAKSKEEFLEMFIKRYPTNGKKDLHDWGAVDEHFNPIDSNFWRSINKGQAEIHMMALAEEIYDAMNESTPKQLKAGEWHIPFEDKIHKVDTSIFSNPDDVNTIFDLIRVKISTAMAARTSYTVVGDEKEIDYKKMIELHDRLIAQNPPHSSPLEHCARVMTDDEYERFVKGYLDQDVIAWSTPIPIASENSQGWCNNFKGFISYRYLVDNKIGI